MEVVPLGPPHRDFVDSLMREHFGSSRIVSLGTLHDSSTLPGLIALHERQPIGFLLFDVRSSECEIVALVSAVVRRDVARTLVEHLVASADPRIERIVLVTTNDNLSAQAFYNALGFTLVRVHTGAVARAREVKPEIPLVGEGGVTIEDELEYELSVPT